MEMTNHRKGIFARWSREFGLTIEQYFELCKTKKRCQKCKEWKPREEFSKDSSRHDGLHVRCSKCHRINRAPKWYILNEEEKERIRERNRKNKWMLGKKLSLKQKTNLRRIAIEQKRFVGENSPQWKGGITPQNQIARNSSEYREWRRKVFERDHYTCRRCGNKKGGNLHPHHIKSFSEYPELRFIISNGITLCFDCHSNEHNEPLSSRKLRVAKRLGNPKNQLKMF